MGILTNTLCKQFIKSIDQNANNAYIFNDRVTFLITMRELLIPLHVPPFFPYKRFTS